MVLDNEFLGALQRFTHEFRITEETIGLEIGALEYEVLVPSFVRSQLLTKKGEEVTIRIPSGERTYEVLEVRTLHDLAADDTERA